MGNDDQKNSSSASNSSASDKPEQSEEKHVINPFEEGSENLSKEELENIEQFKEAQTERD